MWDEYDVVSEAQDNEKLDFAKVSSIDKETEYAYMSQIKEMLEENVLMLPLKKYRN